MESQGEINACRRFEASVLKNYKLALDVEDGILVNPWHYNEPIVLLREGFNSSEFAETASVQMLCAMWSLFVDAKKLRRAARELGATILEDGNNRLNEYFC